MIEEIKHLTTKLNDQKLNMLIKGSVNGEILLQ